MLLYHGTTSLSAARALKQGILPRSKLGQDFKGNWEHTILSHPDRVYLTDVYAFYFAMTACKNKGDRPAVIEIDTDLIDDTLLVADEDALAQVFKKDNVSLIESTEYYRDEETCTDWQASMAMMGTCAFYGAIPSSAITRICIINPEIQKRSLWTAMDASISILNYTFCKAKYKNLTGWFFGDEKLSEEKYLGAAGENRHGIQVLFLK